MSIYQVIEDPLEPGCWRVIIDDHFAAKKFKDERAAATYVDRLQAGAIRPEFSTRRERVHRDVVLETKEVQLVRTQIEHEAFTFTTAFGDVLTWDVTLAREAAERGDVVGLQEIQAQVLVEIAASNEWTRAGVAQADPSKHGIAAPIIAMNQIVYVLIDGTHRAVRALQDGRPFCAWLLTDKANRACLVRGREGIVP